MNAKLSYQHYDLNNYGQFFSFDEGNSNILALELKLLRNSVSDPIFPVWGSNVEINVKATAPYSLFNQTILRRLNRSREIQMDRIPQVEG